MSLPPDRKFPVVVQLERHLEGLTAEQIQAIKQGSTDTMVLGTDLAIVGRLIFLPDGSLAQAVEAFGVGPNNREATSNDIFAFWLNLGLQLARRPDLDDVRRSLAHQTSHQVMTIINQLATEAEKKKIIV